MLIVAALVVTVVAAEGAWAQFYRFGKNKVQFAEFDWQELVTPHFNVYFFVEEDSLAAIAAHMAESSYRRLERLFGHTVARRIPLIVYSSHIYFEQTNVIPSMLPEGVGGFTEFLKGRVALPLSSSLSEFERVLTHELVHVFTFDRIRQILRRHGLNRYHMPPLWFSEGLAEYWAGGWDTNADMIMRDAIFADRLVPISQMHHINGTYQMYKEGQSICAFMAATYGEDVFERLFSGWWRGEDFGAIFEAVTGDPLTQLDRDWQYAQRKRYLPDIARGDLPSQGGRQQTDEGFNMKPAVVRSTADTTVFVFFRNYRGYTHIAWSTLHDEEPQVLDPGEQSPAVESLHPLTSKLAVSPDGQQLAYSVKHRGRDHLYVRQLAGSGRVQDLAFDQLIAISSPTWSPDGSLLAFSGSDPGGRTDLYILDVEAGDLRRLTHDLYHDSDPDWSPDGHYLVFSSDRCSAGETGQYNLFVMTLPAGEILQLTSGDHSDMDPAWSSDGRYVAFSSDRDGIHNIHAVRFGTDPSGHLVRSQACRMTRVLTGAFDPAWLRAGDGLLYAAYEGGTFQIVHGDVTPESLDTLRLTEAIPEAADSPWPPGDVHARHAYAAKEYERKLSLDVAQSQISQDPQLGTSGGVQLAMSDVLGNEQYFLVLSQVTGSQTGFFDGMNVALARLHQGSRLNTLCGVFRLNDRLTSRYGRYVREKRTGAYVELQYPFSRHDRLEVQSSVRLAEIDRRIRGQRLDGWLVNNMVTYTHDSSLWIPTGPLEGRRYSVGIAQTVDFKASRRFNITLFGDYRHYFRLSRRSALASRLMARQSRGDVPEYFALGGSWTLRGYPWLSIWGSKMLLVNQELRFPLVDRLVVRFPFGNADFSALRGALFVDAGNAWTDDFGEWHGSVGAGVRVALGGVFVFRLDGARRTDFKSIGSDTHWDFFFGWDF